MTGSSHREFRKWLAGLLQSVLERFSSTPSQVVGWPITICVGAVFVNSTNTSFGMSGCKSVRHIAYQICLRLLRPCKILTWTLMSLCVFLMCPACSPTFPLMKPSKSVQMPFMTIPIYNHSFQRTCLLN